MGNAVTEEFISRTEALKDFESCNAENPNWTPQRVKTLLLRQPAADVAEVRHGRWIFEPGKIPYCSECKEYSDDGDKGATFCPWCGARMNKEADHD